VGFTTDLVAGVWLGNDDGAPTDGVTGGSLPARLWRSVMARSLEGVPQSPLPGGGPAVAEAVEPPGGLIDRILFSLQRSLNPDGAARPGSAARRNEP
jgi:membrane peptidoglycan carboxypeptidase